MACLSSARGLTDLRSLGMRPGGWQLLVLLSCLAACAPQPPSQLQPISATDPAAAFKLRVDRLREELDIPGLSLAVLSRQQILFAEGFGYSNLEERIPATPETPYNIASLTKIFAAAVLMKLVESGQLDLEAEMAVLLEEKDFWRGRQFHGYSEACQAIKKASRNPFLSHQSLLRDYRCDSDRITVRHHLTHTAQGLPGENYRYNGFLFGILSAVVEVASGKDFDQMLVETIIEPLGMTRTVPGWDAGLRDRVLAERATYYRRLLFGFVPSEYRTRLSASAGMVSTVMDLAKFDIALDRDLIVTPATKKAMFSPTRSNSGKRLPYGLGWFVQEHEGMKLIWHYGHAPHAYSSLILKCLDRESALILLANSDGASAPFNLGAGDVLRSPFALAFLEFIAQMTPSS